MESARIADKKREVDWLQSAEDGEWRLHTNVVGPLDLLGCFANATRASDPLMGNALLFTADLYPYLRQDQFQNDQNLHFVRAMKELCERLRTYHWEGARRGDNSSKTLLLLAPPSFTLNSELERDVWTLDFPLPETSELQEVCEDFIARNQSLSEEESSQKIMAERISNAAVGLTLDQFRLGLSEFAIVKGDLSLLIDRMKDFKAETIRSRSLEYVETSDKPRLGGLEKEKEWIRQRKEAFASEAERRLYHLPKLTGILLSGPSGTGKSSSAKLIASEFEVPLIRLNFAALFGRFVGDSESELRNAQCLCEALKPIVLWVDEIEKAITLDSRGDSGVSARLFGEFLTWMNEKPNGIFVVATANDHTKLPTELLRKGRFDEVIWVDLPSEAARKEIFRVHLDTYHEAGYLVLNPDRISELRQAHAGIDQCPESGDLFDRFVSLLSEPEVSLNLTGAEIEASVRDALWQARSMSKAANDSTRSFFTETVVFQAVKEMAARALYRSGTPESQRLEAMRQSTASWLKAE